MSTTRIHTSMRNFPAFRLAARTLTLAAVIPAVAQAHPGHDGHELTWDMSHLAQYPWATLGCFAAVGGIVWLAGRAVRIRADRSRGARVKIR